MKKLFLLLPLIAIGCASQEATSGQQAIATPDMLEQAMMNAKVSGICATHDKMFGYAKSTNKKENMDFVKEFLSNSAREIGENPDGFIKICQDAFATSSRLQAVIDKYK